MRKVVLGITDQVTYFFVLFQCVLDITLPSPSPPKREPPEKPALTTPSWLLFPFNVQKANHLRRIVYQNHFTPLANNLILPFSNLTPPNATLAPYWFSLLRFISYFAHFSNTILSPPSYWSETKLVVLVSLSSLYSVCLTSLSLTLTVSLLYVGSVVKRSLHGLQLDTIRSTMPLTVFAAGIRYI
jgi:hypothetical protein